jgi:hypothetical protein
LNIQDSDSSKSTSNTILLANKNIRISFYPNPFNNDIMMKAPVGKYFISITNMEGKKVFNTNFATTGADIKIVLPALTPGVYNILIKDETGNTKKEKIIKE